MNDLFIQGLHITVLGMGVVFISLSLLVVCLYLIRLVSRTDAEPRTPGISRDASPLEVDSEKAKPDLAGEELVAAISACLAFMETGSDRIT
ncbi:MAG: OadG family protein [Bacillota bacterium]|jgi:sodium pump decarboxylase gamma subunit